MLIQDRSLSQFIHQCGDWQKKMNRLNILMLKKFLYRKFFKGYPVMPINLALPDCWTFLNAGRVSLIIMSRFGANSISWTCGITKKGNSFVTSTHKVAYKSGVQKKKIDWLIDWLIDWCLTPNRQYLGHFNGGGKKDRLPQMLNSMTAKWFISLPRTSKLLNILYHLFTNKNNPSTSYIREISKEKNYVKFW